MIWMQRNVSYYQVASLIKFGILRWDNTPGRQQKMHERQRLAASEI